MTNKIPDGGIDFDGDMHNRMAYPWMVMEVGHRNENLMALLRHGSLYLNTYTDIQYYLAIKLTTQPLIIDINLVEKATYRQN